MPPALATDPEFRERFDREARVISSLSHPHICPLYDVGQAPNPDHKPDTIQFLVMEYLEGETLATRLEKGAMKIDDALQVGVQIASALDAAHRAGVVHRDLKPGNIFLTKNGAKLLDFGLAKNAPVVGRGFNLANASAQPTMTTPPTLTAQGTILGTFQYMAPEQIEGLDADARTDIFAFGAVLYEMLTGRKAFEGKTRASLLGAILKDTPPPLSTVQPLAPRALGRIVTTCLAKERDDRWQTARDLLRELKWVTEAGADAGDASAVSVAVQPAGWRRALALSLSKGLPWAIAAGALAMGLALVLTLWAPWRTVPPPAPLRMSVDLGADASLVTNEANQGAAAVLSPDGAVLAFVAQKSAGGNSQLYVRRLEQLQAEPLSGTDDARSPFFSPDGQWIAFFAGGKLKKISVAGGAAVTLCDAPNGRGGSWAEDGTIAFSPDNSPGVSLWRVSSAGGKPEPLTTLGEGEITQRWPQVLPGARAVLFTGSSITGNYEDANLVVQPLPTGTRKIVQRGGYYGRYLPSGHLVYMHDGTLFAAPFDLDRLEITGQPVPALEGVTANPGAGGGAQFGVSGTGTLAYLPGQGVSFDVPISWVDREGKTTPLRATPTAWSNPQFAPDGRRLALDVFDGRQLDVRVYDLARDALSRLTFDPADDAKPVWTPDGGRITFGSRRADKSTLNLYWQKADGTGEVQRLTDSKNSQYPGSWHPSGKVFAFTEYSLTNYDLMILPIEGDETSGWKPGKPTVFLNGPFPESEPMFSPDGRWLAYHSNESGRNEVYVRPFPGPGGKWQISTDGGVIPTWSRTHRELFYATLDQQIMLASYAVEGDSFRTDKPRLWSERRYRLLSRAGIVRPFDLHPDGERFALAPVSETQSAARQDKVVLIFNFFDELRRIAPVRK